MCCPCRMAMIHGDDFIYSGSMKPLRWFRPVLESMFEVSTVVVGDGRQEEIHETKVLNRIIRMDHDGWHYEEDQRHGKFLLNFQEVQTPREDEKRLAGGGGPRVLEQPAREPVSGVGGESQLFRFGPPTSSTRSRR